MNVNDKSFYEQQFDRMLQPDLWAKISIQNSGSNKENLEKDLTQKLSSIARDYFKKHKNDLPQPKSASALVEKFFEIGVANQWLTKDKVEFLEDMAKQVGLMGRTGRARVPIVKNKGGITKLIIDILRSQNKEVDIRDASPVRGKRKTEPSKSVDKIHSSDSTTRIKVIIDYLRSTGEYEVVDESGRSLLQRSILKKNFELSKALIEIGANLDFEDSIGLTPLHYAATSSEGRILDFMLERRVNLEVQGAQKQTPLFLAVNSDIKANVEKLLDAGAKINHRNIEERTVLHQSFYLPGQSEISKLLIDRGADVNARDIEGRTPLFIAVTFGNIEGVRLLLNSGANPLVIDKEGRNVYQILKENDPKNYEEIKSLLSKFEELSMIGKEQLQRRVIAHAIDEEVQSKLLTGDNQILVLDSSYEGIVSHYAMKKMLRSFEVFSRDHPSYISKGVMKILREAVEMSLKFPQPTEELYQRWLLGKPILLNAGFADHHTSMVFWYDNLVICNRGSGSVIQDDLSTQRMYEFQLENLTRDVLIKIEELQTRGDKKQYLNFITSELPETLKVYREPFKEQVRALGLPPQVIGNCSWANGEAGIYALMWLHSLLEYDESLTNIDDDKVEELISIQNTALKNWQLHHHIAIINKYSEWIKNPDNRLVPDFNRVDVATQRKFLFRGRDQGLIENLEKAKDDWNKAKMFWRSRKLSMEMHYQF